MDCFYKLTKTDGGTSELKEITALWGLSKHLYFRDSNGVLCFKEVGSATVVSSDTKQVMGTIDVESLWKEFRGISLNPETNCLEETWNRFKEGTNREDIGHWFEDEFGTNIVLC